MANIKDLKKYIGYEFSSGCYTGDDYKSFQTKYINFLKAICKQNHWQLVNVGRNHKSIINILRNSRKKLNEIAERKVKILELPMIQKRHIS